MNAMTILYEGLHCLFCAWLTYWLIGKTIAAPHHPMLYATTVAVVCLLLGDAYWLAHLIIRGNVPEILSACDVAYVGMWLIFHAALPRPQKLSGRQAALAALMGVFTVLNGVGWTVWTQHWLLNLIWTIPLFLLAVRSALLLDVRLNSLRGYLFLPLPGLLLAAETASFLWPEFWDSLNVLCAILWLCSLMLFAWLLKGKAPFRQLPIPAWMLLIVYCECASLLSSDWAYFVFQVLLAGAIGYFARIVGKEGETLHAV